MKAGWTEVALGDICEFRYGKALKAAERSGGVHPVFGSNGRVGLHQTALTSGPTIVIGRKGSYGEVHYSPEPVWPIDTTFYIDANATGCDLRWLAFRLKALGLSTLNRAAAVPGLSREDAYRKRLLLPPPDEQRRIAHLLDRADGLREARRRTIELLNTMIPASFRSMFGDPVVNARGWPTCDLRSLGDLDRGISRHRPRNAPELLGGPYPLIQTGDVARSGGVITEYSSTYSEAGLRQSRLWPAGTLCITIAANIALTGVLGFDACFPDSVVGFTSDAPTTTYVQAWMAFLQPALERSAPEFAQKNINLKILRVLPVPIAPETDRAAFADRVNAIRSAIDLHRKHLGRLGALSDCLQHHAFAGEL